MLWLPLSGLRKLVRRQGECRRLLAHIHVPGQGEMVQADAAATAALPHLAKKREQARFPAPDAPIRLFPWPNRNGSVGWICRSRFARPVIPMSFKLFRRGPMRFAFRISLSWRSNRRSSQRITVSSSADLDGDGCRRGIRPGFIGGCGIIFDRLSRMETHPSSRVEHEIGEP